MKKIKRNFPFDIHCNIINVKNALNFHSHYNFHEIYYIFKGSIVHSCNGIDICYPEGSLLFVRENDTHRLIKQEDHTPTFCLLVLFETSLLTKFSSFCNDSFFETLILSSNIAPAINIPLVEQKRIRSVIDPLFIMGSDEHNNHTKKSSLSALLFTLLHLFYTYYHPKDLTSNQINSPDWFTNLLPYTYDKQFLIRGGDYLTEISNKNKSYLSKCFRKYLNTTLSEYLNTKRIQYAASLLKNSNFDILDICYECGYKSTSYFYASFNKQFNMPPSAYRTNHSNPTNYY